MDKIDTCTVVLINVCCLQDMGASVSSQEEAIPLYYVTRKEHMSPERNTADTDDALPPAVRTENTQAEYETVPIVQASTPTTSENPPPMIRGDSEAPDLPPPYNPAVDNESAGDLSVESSISQGVENQSVDEEVDESLKKDLSESLDNGEEATEGSTEAQPNKREVSQSVPEGDSEVVEGEDKLDHKHEVRRTKF